MSYREVHCDEGKEDEADMKQEKKHPLIQVEHLEKHYLNQGTLVRTKLERNSNRWKEGKSFDEKQTSDIQKKEYAIKHGTKAVDDVSFTIYEGETLGLVGESGCGKTTIGKLLAGLEKPTNGRILFDGKDFVSMNERERKKIRTQIQMVFQDTYSSLNPRKHIYEILSQPMLYHKISTKDTIEKDMGRILDMVGLPKTALGRYPHEFSGGQRQRIGIAKALSVNPRFLICDEPVSALDVSVQAQILNLLNELKQELNLTMLFIGHGLGAVNYVSDRVAVMHQGRFVEEGSAKEVFLSAQHPYTKTLIEAVPEISYAASAASGAIRTEDIHTRNQMGRVTETVARNTPKTDLDKMEKGEA